MINRLFPAIVFAAVLLTPAAVAAQGTLSSQGFGFPPGQFSTRARATAGSFGEFDSQSPINPASLSAWGRPALFVQYDPEFRRSMAGGAEDRASTSRFPLMAAALPIKQRFMFGIAASTLLDRTWATQFTRRELIGTDSVTFSESSRAVGAISDARLAFGWSRSASLRLGAGLHMITGENTLRVRRAFEETGFDTLDQTARRSFGGVAGSLGIESRVTRDISVAGSWRIGGKMRAYSGDTLVSEGRVPSRMGAAVRFTGVRGVALATSVNWTQWSSMRELGTSRLTVDDALDFGIGMEARGPRWFDNDIPLRAGYRRRTLPFTLEGESSITESDLTAGFGIPLSRSRSNIDFAIERAARWGAGGGSETAWTFSFGILVRQ